MTTQKIKAGDEVIWHGLSGNLRAIVKEIDSDGYHVKVSPLENHLFELEEGIATYADEVWTDLGSCRKG